MQSKVPSMEILAKIIESKMQRLAAAKSLTPMTELKQSALTLRRSALPYAFRSALMSGDGPRIIAEFKRRSPSKGLIRENVSPQQMTGEYENGGAAAISVLTEEDHFGGSLQDLSEVVNSANVPVLRKDFIIDEFQVYETAAAGADALLLIVAALEKEKLKRLLELTEAQLQMDALVEVHTENELATALTAGATLIGVNNRNLKTFEVSLDTSRSLAPLVNDQALLISESGLRSRQDLAELFSLGYRGFLIGETLMRSSTPAEDIRRLISGANRGSAQPL
jgi:indole-3-glycerol phosphate synthase